MTSSHTLSGAASIAIEAVTRLIGSPGEAVRAAPSAAGSSPCV